MNRQIWIIIGVLTFLLAACTDQASLVPETDTNQDEQAIIAATATPEGDAEPRPTSELAQESASSQHPAEQLIAAFTEPSTTNGELLILYGQVLDVNESPIADAAVEIWQTDASGVYDHPGDPETDGRDATFQFYGMATTDADGWYAFRTIVPGRYEPRPRHIHFKVKQDATELLTSQFYFSDDIAEVQGEGMFQAVGESGDLLLIQLVQGEGQLLGNGQIVVDTGVGSGALPLTPSQATGPYYPVVDLAAYDNDLTRLP